MSLQHYVTISTEPYIEFQGDSSLKAIELYGFKNVFKTGLRG